MREQTEQGPPCRRALFVTPTNPSLLPEQDSFTTLLRAETLSSQRKTEPRLYSPGPITPRRLSTFAARAFFDV